MSKFQKGNQQLIIGVVIVVLIAGAIWYFSANRPADDEAMMEDDKMMEAEGEMMEKEDGAMMEDGDAMMEGEKMMMELETAELSAVGDYSGSGTATRKYDGEEFAHTVTASLGDPADGKFYEGWLVKKTPSLTFISTGKLAKAGDGYSLSFSSDNNYPDHKDVVITEETESLGLDGNPEDHVLEGTF